MKHSPWKANSHPTRQDFPNIFRTWTFISTTTRAHRWSQTWPRRMEPTPFHSASLDTNFELFVPFAARLPIGLFQGSLSKLCMRFSYVSCMLHLIFLDLIIPTRFGKNWNSESRLYATVSILLILRPPSINIRPVVWETKFHTCTKPPEGELFSKF
jgi:hypothetical protein